MADESTNTFYGDKVYILKEGLDFMDMGDDSIVAFDPDSDKTCILNEIGEMILKSLDGKTSINEMISGFSSEYDADIGMIRSDVYNFMDKIIDSGLIAEVPAAGNQKLSGKQESEG